MRKLFVFLLLTLTMSYANLLDDLTHYYTLDGHAYDSTGSVDGTIDTLLSTVIGVSDSAIFMDNDSSRTIKFSSNLGINPYSNNGATYSCWLKKDSVNHFIQVIKGFEPTSDLSSGIIVNSSTSATYCYYYTYQETGSDSYKYYKFNAAVQDTNWHHLAIVYKDLNDVDFYMDGVKYAESDSSGGLSSLNDAMFNNVGEYHFGNPDYVYKTQSGTIDEVAIFEGALDSVTIVDTLYDGGSGWFPYAETPPKMERFISVDYYGNIEILNDDGTLDKKIDSIPDYVRTSYYRYGTDSLYIGGFYANSLHDTTDTEIWRSTFNSSSCYSIIANDTVVYSCVSSPRSIIKYKTDGTPLDSVIIGATIEYRPMQLFLENDKLYVRTWYNHIARYDLNLNQESITSTSVSPGSGANFCDYISEVDSFLHVSGDGKVYKSNASGSLNTSYLSNQSDYTYYSVCVINSDYCYISLLDGTDSKYYTVRYKHSNPRGYDNKTEVSERYYSFVLDSKGDNIYGVGSNAYYCKIKVSDGSVIFENQNPSNTSYNIQRFDEGSTPVDEWSVSQSGISLDNINKISGVLISNIQKRSGKIIRK